VSAGVWRMVRRVWWTGVYALLFMAVLVVGCAALFGLMVALRQAGAWYISLFTRIVQSDLPFWLQAAGEVSLVVVPFVVYGAWRESGYIVAERERRAGIEEVK
jgi:hypothetical protein